MKKAILFSIIGLSLLSCSGEKNKDNSTNGTNIVEKTINKITTPKLFVEGEWVYRNYPIQDAYKDKPYYTIEAQNDSTLIFKINAYKGRNKFKYSETIANITTLSEDKIIATDSKSPTTKYTFTKTEDGIKMYTNTINFSRFFIPFK